MVMRCDQWWKRRNPEKAMTILYSSAAAMTCEAMIGDHGW
jgi:hypothetical protein